MTMTADVFAGRRRVPSLRYRFLSLQPLMGQSPFGDSPSQPWIETSSGMIKIATMFVILIIGLIAGPAVSL